MTFQLQIDKNSFQFHIIYIGMNPLRKDAATRTKEDIESIRHVYLDLDHDGPEVLEAVENSSAVPKPNYVLNSSPEKYQVVWRVQGMNLEEAEGLLHAMTSEFGGDPAATDATRVLRVPGFANKKYATNFYLEARRESTETYPFGDFKLHIDSQDSPRRDYNKRAKQEPWPRTNLSQSEHDWASIGPIQLREPRIEELCRVPVIRVFWKSEVQSMRRFEFAEGSSNKFWEVTVSGNTLTVRFGRVVSKGQEKSKTFATPELAQKEQGKLIAEKLGGGYKEVGSSATGEAGPSAEGSAAKLKSAEVTLSDLLGSPALKRVAPQLKRLQRTSIRITTAPWKEHPVGRSKLGGRPDLPAGMSWPLGRVAGREIALPFIAQFEVARLWRLDTEFLLPSSGMLYFFYNMADYGADYLAPENWRVIYHGGDSNLAPSEPPLSIPPHLDCKARVAKFQNEVTLPSVETCYIGGPGNTGATVELTDEEWKAYANLRYEWRANKNIHQMLGHADDVQPYALENSYESVRDVFFPDGRPFLSLTPQEQNEEFLQGRLLLQVDEEKSIKMQFGRGGRLYFFIREQDLKARDFSKVWVNEQ